MAFDDIVRMQLDIETFALRPDRPENEVFLVSISDNTGLPDPDIRRRAIDS